VRVLLEHVLIDGGYEVDSTTTVAEAKSLLDSVGYELLLADGRLPDGTGMVLAEYAQASGVKTLIITGYAFQLASQDLGRYEFLMKPVRPAELLQAIERALGDGT
jgi:DNA-binding NtrC family response regulator